MQTASAAMTIEVLVRAFLAHFVESNSTPRRVGLLGRAHLAGGAPALARVAQLLSFLPKGSEGAFSQLELAEVLGISRGHLNILLAELGERGALTVTRRSIRVASYPVLKRIASGQEPEKGGGGQR